MPDRTYLPEPSLWKVTEPPEARAARRAAWQAHRSCIDCRFWDYDPEYDTGRVAACTSRPTIACSVVVPEDYTCEDFAAKERADAD